MLIERVATNPAYRWANNDENVGQVKMRLKDLESQMSPFAHEFLIHDTKSMKELAGPGFIDELEGLASLKPLLTALAKETSQLLGMRSKRS